MTVQKKYLILIALFFSGASFAQVAVGTDATTPPVDESAVVNEMQNTTPSTPLANTQSPAQNNYQEEIVAPPPYEG